MLKTYTYYAVLPNDKIPAELKESLPRGEINGTTDAKIQEQVLKVFQECELKKKDPQDEKSSGAHKDSAITSSSVVFFDKNFDDKSTIIVKLILPFELIGSSKTGGRQTFVLPDSQTIKQEHIGAIFRNTKGIARVAPGLYAFTEKVAKLFQLKQTVIDHDNEEDDEEWEIVDKSPDPTTASPIKFPSPEKPAPKLNKFHKVIEELISSETTFCEATRQAAGFLKKHQNQVLTAAGIPLPDNKPKIPLTKHSLKNFISILEQLAQMPEELVTHEEVMTQSKKSTQSQSIKTDEAVSIATNAAKISLINLESSFKSDGLWAKRLEFMQTAALSYQTMLDALLAIKQQDLSRWQEFLVFLGFIPSGNDIDQAVAKLITPVQRIGLLILLFKEALRFSSLVDDDSRKILNTIISSLETSAAILNKNLGYIGKVQGAFGNSQPTPESSRLMNLYDWLRDHYLLTLLAVAAAFAGAFFFPPLALAFVPWIIALIGTGLAIVTVAFNKIALALAERVRAAPVKWGLPLLILLGLVIIPLAVFVPTLLAISPKLWYLIGAISMVLYPVAMGLITGLINWGRRLWSNQRTPEKGTTISDVMSPDGKPQFVRRYSDPEIVVQGNLLTAFNQSEQEKGNEQNANTSQQETSAEQGEPAHLTIKQRSETFTSPISGCDPRNLHVTPNTSPTKQPKHEDGDVTRPDGELSDHPPAEHQDLPTSLISSEEIARESATPKASETQQTPEIAPNQVAEQPKPENSEELSGEPLQQNQAILSSPVISSTVTENVATPVAVSTPEVPAEKQPDSPRRVPVFVSAGVLASPITFMPPPQVNLSKDETLSSVQAEVSSAAGGQATLEPELSPTAPSPP